MAYEDTLYEALATEVSAFAASLDPQVPVIFSTLGDSTPNDGNWLEFKLFFNEPQPYALEANGVHLMTGFLRLGVGTRPKQTLSHAYGIAGAISNHFRKGRVLDSTTNTQVQRAPQVSGDIESQGNSIIP